MTRPMTEAEARAKLKAAMPGMTVSYLLHEGGCNLSIQIRGKTRARYDDPLSALFVRRTLRAAVSAAIRAWQRAKVAR